MINFKLGLCIALVVVPQTYTQSREDFISPCPSIFTYEPEYQYNTTEPKWYGVVNLSTDTTLYALWLNIVVDSDADVLGNWVGEVTTEDNLDFKIENTKLKIIPEEPLAVRFFIQYNAEKRTPKLYAIRFNGKEICNADHPETVDPYGVTSTTNSKNSYTTTSRTITKGTKSDNIQNDSSKYWTQSKPETTTQATVTKSRSTTQAQYKTTEKRQPVKSEPVQTAKPQTWSQTKTVQTKNTQTKKEDKVNTTAQQGNVNSWSQKKEENNAPTKIEQTTQKYNQSYFTHTRATEKASQYTTHSSQAVRQNSSTLAKLDWMTTTNIPLRWQAQIDTKTTTSSRWPSETHTTTIVPSWPLGFDITTKTTPRSPQELDTSTKTRHIYDTTKVSSESPPIFYTTTKAPPRWPSIDTTTKQNGWGLLDYNDQTKYEIYSQTSATVPPIVKYDTDKTMKTTSHRPEYIETQYFNLEINQVNHNPDNNGYGSTEIYPNRETISQTYTESQPNIKSEYSQGLKTKPSVNYQNGEISKPHANHQSDNYSEYNLPTDSKTDLKVTFSVEPYELASGYKTENQRNTSVEYSDTSTYNQALFSQKGSSEQNPNSNIYSELQLTTETFFLATNKVSTTEDSASSYSKDDEDSDYVGGLPTLYIPNHGPHTTQNQCGKVLFKPSYSQSSAIEGQWPWQIALYQQQKSTVDFKYICGGTLVSRRHVVTAAHCVTRRGTRRMVNKVTLTVYLGKSNLRTSVDGVQIKFVNKIIVHPGYNGTTFAKDIAVLQLREPVTFSNWVQPACLWPEEDVSLGHLVGKSGSVVGWGFDVSGAAREELSLLEMPVVDGETCFNSFDFYQRFTSDYTYCARYKEGTTVCNGDSGGGMVFKKRETWYLRGVASHSVARQHTYRCDPNHYVIFTDAAKFLTWIEEEIEDY